MNQEICGVTAELLTFRRPARSVPAYARGALDYSFVSLVSGIPNLRRLRTRVYLAGFDRLGNLVRLDEACFQRISGASDEQCRVIRELLRSVDLDFNMIVGKWRDPDRSPPTLRLA